MFLGSPKRHQGDSGERSDLGSSRRNLPVRLSHQHSRAAPAIPAKCGSVCAACSRNPSAKELKPNQLYWPADARAISVHFWQHMPVHCSGSMGTHLPSPGCCSFRGLSPLGDPLWAPTSSKAQEAMRLEATASSSAAQEYWNIQAISPLQMHKPSSTKKLVLLREELSFKDRKGHLGWKMRRILVCTLKEVSLML